MQRIGAGCVTLIDITADSVRDRARPAQEGSVLFRDGTAHRLRPAQHCKMADLRDATRPAKVGVEVNINFMLRGVSR